MDVTLGVNSGVEGLEYEVVERKGLGHPDTLADGIAESISLAYSKHCIETFGLVLHHNVDKISILGGLCDIRYGYGEMIKPIRLILNGRMSKSFASVPIDIERMQKDSATGYLKERLPRFDIERRLEVHNFVTSNSRNPYFFNPRDASDLPEHTSAYANDTSTMTGFWPLSELEKSVLRCECSFYEKSMKPKFSFVGQDIKVMAVRSGNSAKFVVCAPFFASQITDEKDYFEKKQIVYEYLLWQLRNGENSHDITLDLNTEDNRVNKARKPLARELYFCVSGSALDYGEEGVVGRGNRTYGLISCMRPSTAEAICGKNPVYHVGKVYNYVLREVSRLISEEFDCKVDLVATTRNGDPLYDPSKLNVNASKKLDKDKVTQLIKRSLADRDWTKEILEKKVFLPTSDFNVLS